MFDENSDPAHRMMIEFSLDTSAARRLADKVEELLKNELPAGFDLRTEIVTLGQR